MIRCELTIVCRGPLSRALLFAKNHEFEYHFSIFEILLHYFGLVNKVFGERSAIASEFRSSIIGRNAIPAAHTIPNLRYTSPVSKRVSP